MNSRNLKNLLISIKNKEISIEDALAKMNMMPFEDLGFAKIDTHRELRKGFPEVVLCQGKSIDQIRKILKRHIQHSKTVMATRANQNVFDSIKNEFSDIKYFEQARIILLGKKKQPKHDRYILVITAGSADIPVAEEAAITADIMGNIVERLYDCGVAGVHRLLYNKHKIFRANVLIIVAGMDGALPSLVGGLVNKPVIAVPASVGYGASFGGVSALLTMLNSCAPGISVVNIDNGFGAGYQANIINNLNKE